MLSKIANFLKLKTVTVPPQKTVDEEKQKLDKTAMETPVVTTTNEASVTIPVATVDASLTGIKPVEDEPVKFVHAQVETVTEPAPKAKRKAPAKTAAKKTPAKKTTKNAK